VIKRNSWSKDAEEIVREMPGRTLPGLPVFAPMVAAVALLQVKITTPTSPCKPKGRSDVKLSRTSLLMLLAIAGMAVAYSQAVPPWSKGTNNPAAQKGYEFHVADVDNVPDIHGNPADARLVIFIGGNQFFVPPKLITAFEQKHPELQGHIFYETLPPGILRKQIAADGAITLGNLTIQVKPDVYEAGARVLREMEQHGRVKGVVEYATNDLEIMVPAGNPKKIQSLNDLARLDLRLSMPNPQWEGIANQIADSLRKAGGESLYEAVYQDKVKNGKTVLTQIHHRQTPMRIMTGQLDAGVTWASEVRFQQSINNPIGGVAIPANQNTTAIYAGGVLKNAPHPELAARWLEFLKSQEAQDIYHQFGFGSMRNSR
jgi:ABC-type molybdate transport system substrate-binding protein